MVLALEPPRQPFRRPAAVFRLVALALENPCLHRRQALGPSAVLMSLQSIAIAPLASRQSAFASWAGGRAFEHSPERSTLHAMRPEEEQIFPFSDFEIDLLYTQGYNAGRCFESDMRIKRRSKLLRRLVGRESTPLTLALRYNKGRGD